MPTVRLYLWGWKTMMAINCTSIHIESVMLSRFILLKWWQKFSHPAAAASSLFSVTWVKTKQHLLPHLSDVYRSSIRSYKSRGRNWDRNNFTLTRASCYDGNKSNKDASENTLVKERNGYAFIGGRISIIASTMRCIIEDRGFMYRR